MPVTTGVRAEASRRVRDAIVAATVRIVAREGVAAVTHRRVAAEAGVALSSTTWHFATKADILEAALRWTARREVERIGAIADRLGGTDFDPSAWADELADWLVEQVTDRARGRRRALPAAGRAARLSRARSRSTASGARGCARSASACSRLADRDARSSTSGSSSPRSTGCGWACSTPASRTSSGCAWRSAASCRRCSAEPGAYAKAGAGRRRGSGNQRGPLRTGFGWRCMR